MNRNKTGLPGSAEPWGRDVEKRLGNLEHHAGIVDTTLDGLRGRVDKSVYKSYEYGMNIANAINGKLSFDQPTDVQFVSGSGLFEVTVSLAGLVSYGAVLGAGFESDEYSYGHYFDIPTYGVVASCSPTDSRWVPFASSRSTILSNRPGIYNFSLYLHAVTNQNAQAVGYVNKAQISVKAV